MTEKIDESKSRALIGDIISSQRDVIELAAAHELKPEDLALWISEPDNHRKLAGLCVLADLQTQLLLSRYRSLAASRLFRLATEEGEGDVARRACMDLLRADLKRAGIEAPDVEASGESAPERAAFYGGDDIAEPATDGEA